MGALGWKSLRRYEKEYGAQNKETNHEHLEEYVFRISECQNGLELTIKRLGSGAKPTKVAATRQGHVDTEGCDMTRKGTQPIDTA